MFLVLVVACSLWTGSGHTLNLLVDVGVGLQGAKFTGNANFRVGAYFLLANAGADLDWRVRSYHLLV